MMAILNSVKWHLTVVLICMSLMASDAEHLFIRLWALCMSSLEKCLFKSFAHFSVGFFVFPEWSCVSFLCILEIKPLSEVSLANMFSQYVGSLCNLVLFSLAMEKLFNLMKSHLFILSLMSLALGDVSSRPFLCIQNIYSLSINRFGEFSFSQRSNKRNHLICWFEPCMSIMLTKACTLYLLLDRVHL